MVLDILLGSVATDKEAQRQHWMTRCGRFNWSNRGSVTFNFGRFSGLSLEEVADTEPSYLHWMLRQVRGSMWPYNGRGHEARSPDLSCLPLNLRRLGLWQRLCLFLSYSSSLA